jgi:iron complex transport system permease protein
MKPLTAPRLTAILVGFALSLALLLIGSPGIGTESSSFTWWDAWRARFGVGIAPGELSGRPFVDTNGDDIVSDEEAAGFTSEARFVGFNLRFSRSLLALQVGATLGICGAVLQVLFRNPLADPYTLGIAGGGSLGALLAIRFGWTVSLIGVSSVALSAFAGGTGVVGAVFVLARGQRRLTSNELLLAGVAMGLFCGAMMMLVTAISDERVTFEAVRWMMGSLDPIARIPGATMLPLILPAWILLSLMSRTLNQYALGEELAAARGVNVPRLQAACILLTTLATGAVVAECGPIGFVGLVVPRIVVLLCGSDCRVVLPASALAGASFLIVCDWGSQTAMRMGGWLMGRQLGSATLPIGVVTAIIGVPFFLTLLRLQRK